MLADIVKNYITEEKKKISTGTLKAHSIKLKNLLDYEKATSIKFTEHSFTLVTAEKFKNWFCDRA